MLSFVSEGYLNEHKEYLNRLYSLCSVNEKMIPELLGVKPEAAPKYKRLLVRYPRECALLAERRLHELYFSSFSNRQYPPSPLAARQFGSEGALLTELYRLALNLPYGFVGVSLNRGEIRLFATSDYPTVLLDGTPVLTLDVCEHAYFGDWGYNKENYLKAALKRLSLDRLDSFL